MYHDTHMIDNETKFRAPHAYLILDITKKKSLSCMYQQSINRKILFYTFESNLKKKSRNKGIVEFTFNNYFEGS